MIRFLSRRFLLALLTTLAAVLLVFVAIRILPNNPVLARFGQHAPPEQVAKAMAAQGWDRPLPEQLWSFTVGLVTKGELGESFAIPGESVAEGLARTFPATVELALAALLIAFPCGVLAGIAAAVWRNRWPDFLCVTGSLLGVSVPVFFLGICLMYVFDDMPLGRRLPIGVDYDRSTGFIVLESILRGRWQFAGMALEHLVLPAVALSSIPMAIIARITRSSMVEVLEADYIRTARAKGASPWRVVLRHALPNAAIPVVNIGGLQVGSLLSGAVLTESVFDWPGLGRYLVNAVKQSDYNVVQGATLLIAAVFVLTNLTVDVMYVMLDPRIRLEGERHG